MLEYLYLFCLLCLTISVPILIRGCFNIHAQLPVSGGDISDRIDKVADLLDEMADIINSAIRFQEELSPITQTHSNPLMAILTAFMSKNTSEANHAATTQPEKWEIHPPNDSTPSQTETILDEYSAVNPDSERDE